MDSSRRRERVAQSQHSDFIVDERTKRGKKEYLVMWKGFGVNDSTWEPEDSLASAKTALDEYVRMNSSRLGSSRRSTRK